MSSCDDTDPNWRNGLTHFNERGELISLISCAQKVDIDGFESLILPQGVTVYHGSGRLQNELVEFPVGPYYYDQSNNPLPRSDLILVASSTKGIEEFLVEANDIPIYPSWYADARTAQIYALDPKRGCKGGDCLFAYDTKKDARLMRIDSPRNLFKLLRMSTMTPKVKDAIQRMMSIEEEFFDESRGVFVMRDVYGLERESLARLSDRISDTVFAQWFCENFSDRFDGYAADDIASASWLEEERIMHHHYTPTEESEELLRFHPEIVFCNVFSVLNRAYEGLDWQAMDPLAMPESVQMLLEQLFLYKTTNTGFHSGNLLQHSIWTLLDAELLTKGLTIKRSEDITRLTVFAAFIHDIGKMVPFNVEEGRQEVIVAINTKSFVYYDVLNHPAYGAQFVLTDSGPTTYDLEEGYTESIPPSTGVLHLSGLASEMGVKYNIEDRLMVATALFHHRVMGKMLLDPLNKGVRLSDLPIDEYIDIVERTYISFGGNLSEEEDRVDLMYITAVISGADIAATQPFRGPQKSTYFHYISNLSKNYPGTTFDTRRLPQLIETICDLARSRS